MPQDEVKLMIVKEEDNLEQPENASGKQWFPSDRALWLPEGSIRAIIAFATTGTALVSIFYLSYIPDTLMVLSGYSLGFYFGGRSNMK